MGFLLTTQHIKDILAPCAKGDWTVFLDAMDPDVHWMVVEPKKDPMSLSGIYVRSSSLSSSILPNSYLPFDGDRRSVLRLFQNVESWKKELMEPFKEHLQGPVHMFVDELDVIGNKVIFEARGEQTQKNGKPYRNT